MTPTPREVCQTLLRIHQGACSVPTNTALGAVFAIMQMEGVVSIRPSGTPGFIDIYSKDFKPRFDAKGEK